MPRPEKSQRRPELLTQSGAARLIGVPRQYIPGLVARGELEGRTDVVEGMLLVTKASAEAAAARRRQAQPAA